MTRRLLSGAGGRRVVCSCAVATTRMRSRSSRTSSPIEATSGNRSTATACSAEMHSVAAHTNMYGASASLPLSLHEGERGMPGSAPMLAQVRAPPRRGVTRADALVLHGQRARERERDAWAACKLLGALPHDVGSKKLFCRLAPAHRAFTSPGPWPLDKCAVTLARSVFVRPLSTTTAPARRPSSSRRRAR